MTDDEKAARLSELTKLIAARTAEHEKLTAQASDAEDALISHQLEYVELIAEHKVGDRVFYDAGRLAGIYYISRIEPKEGWRRGELAPAYYARKELKNGGQHANETRLWTGPRERIKAAPKAA